MRLDKINLALTVVMSVSAPLFATPMASASVPDTVSVAADTDCTEDQTAANKAAVTFYIDQIFNEHDTSVIDTYIAEDLIQHTPSLADGRAPLKTALSQQLSVNPNLSTNVYRVVARGDLVMVHRSLPSGFAVTDIFRVSGGKFVEHWDTIQLVPSTTVSGNDMFSTLSGPEAPGSSKLTNVNERLVTDYFTRLNNDHDLRAVDRYVSSSLYQHDPALANGSAAVKAAYSARFKANPDEIVSESMVIAEGELVSVRYHYQSSAADRGQAIIEIFRVQRDRIVEHWNIVQSVPATSANSNTMF